MCIRDRLSPLRPTSGSKKVACLVPRRTTTLTSCRREIKRIRCRKTHNFFRQLRRLPPTRRHARAICKAAVRTFAHRIERSLFQTRDVAITPKLTLPYPSTTCLLYTSRKPTCPPGRPQPKSLWAISCSHPRIWNDVRILDVRVFER